MKADPKLTAGHNKLWIKFFLTAVYGTMYVRDHQRPEFHAALGIDPDEYARAVYEKTSEISRQVFPLTLDIDHPAWQPTLERLNRASQDLAHAQADRGIAGYVTRGAARIRAAGAFLRLLAIPAKRSRVPATTRLEPAY
jgi:magnesium-protoporphyrin IX monomethyl ester (oxidative) cyclase